ncbi:c-type cytochrome [Acidimicrobiaceae bacterium]|nr:c-type cytochrome [Acidimicrobiaceae bacterium]
MFGNKNPNNKSKDSKPITPNDVRKKIGVVVFTYLFAFSIPKQQSEDLVLESLNNSVRVSEEILEGATIYNQLNCQSCHTQNVRVLIPDSQNGKVLKNRFANKNLILNTGLLRLAPDLSTLASREPTNDGVWLKEYLTDPTSVKEEIPHPSINFLNEQDLDYLITYLLSLGSTNE